jgi:hypothetical protein
LCTIQRSDKKLWPFLAVTLVFPDHTSRSPSIDFIAITKKTTFISSCHYQKFA